MQLDVDLEGLRPHPFLRQHTVDTELPQARNEDAIHDRSPYRRALRRILMGWEHRNRSRRPIRTSGEGAEQVSVQRRTQPKRSAATSEHATM